MGILFSLYMDFFITNNGSKKPCKSPPFPVMSAHFAHTLVGMEEKYVKIQFIELSEAEGYIPKESVINELKSRFTDIYILYDNDFQSEENHGRIYGKHLSTLFGLKQIEIPDKYKSKDPSDLCKNYGREVVKTVILTLLNI